MVTNSVRDLITCTQFVLYTPTPGGHVAQLALYRFYNDGGQLLYVGITNDPPRRMTQHSQDKKWWAQVRGMTVEWYPDRTSVLAAEKRAINVENPLHNVQHKPLIQASEELHLEEVPEAQYLGELLEEIGTDGEIYLDGAGAIHGDESEVFLKRVAVSSAWSDAHEDVDLLHTTVGKLLSHFPAGDVQRCMDESFQIHHAELGYDFTRAKVLAYAVTLLLANH